MKEYLIELFNLLLAYIPTVGVMYYPMWKSRDMKNRTVLISASAILVFLCVALLVFKQIWGTDVQALQAFQSFKLLVGIPAMILPYFIFHKRVWQNLFLLACSFAYNSFSVGISNYIESNWSAPGLPPFMAANITGLCIFALTLPALSILLRRLCENKEAQSIRMWRYIWLLPAVFASANLLTNSFLANTYIGNLGYVINRCFSYAALLITCYLLDSSMQQVSDAIAAKRASEQAEEKADFYRRLAHELVTPLTKISTNIQIANRQEDTDHERLTKSQDEIMRISEMINAALDDQSESGVD